MRRITVAITALVLAISGLVISPASSAQPAQISFGSGATGIATATPATFASGVQNPTPNAVFNSVSCASAGNCVAGGVFYNPNYEDEAFTQSITNVGNSDPATTDAGTDEGETLANTGEANSLGSLGLIGLGFLAMLIGFLGYFSRTLPRNDPKN